MLKLRNVSAFYGGIQALRGVDMEVGEGEIVALIGSNGAGKSTALMAVSGMVPLREGEILFRGEPIHGIRPEKAVAMGICQVPEGRRIFQDLTVLENLDMGAYLRADRAAVRQDLEYVFSLFPILSERRRQPGGTLSGGEQQMLAISRALMARPSLLLLDEPSMGLAPRIISQVFGVVGRINADQGTTILLVEQNANQALKVAGRGYVMENGTVSISGPAERLLGDERVREAYLGL